MSVLGEFVEETRRLFDRLAQLDSERTRLAQQLHELEIAERVLTRFGRMRQTASQSGRSDRTASAVPEKRQRTAHGGQPLFDRPLSDATFRTVRAHGRGASTGELLDFLTRELGMTVNPNSLAVALKDTIVPGGWKIAISAGTSLTSRQKRLAHQEILPCG
jgi:hypothetical protein